MRDRIRVVESALHELTDSAPDEMASLSDLIDLLKEKNIDKFEIDKILTELKNKGEIYEPRHGKYMFTED